MVQWDVRLCFRISTTCSLLNSALPTPAYGNTAFGEAFGPGSVNGRAANVQLLADFRKSRRYVAEIN